MWADQEEEAHLTHTSAIGPIDINIISGRKLKVVAKKKINCYNWVFNMRPGKVNIPMSPFVPITCLDRAYELNPGASLVFYERREGLRSWAGGAFTQKGRFLEQWCWPNWDFYIAASIRGCSFNFTAARVHPWLLFFLTSRSFFLRRGHVFSPQCALFVRPPPDVPSARRTRAELPRGASRVSHSAPGLQVGPRKPCVR